MTYTFDRRSITTEDGQTFAADYSITPSGTVYAFVTIREEDGKPVNLKIRIDASDPNYAAVLRAAQEARQPEPEAAPQEARQPEPEAQPEQEPEATQEEATQEQEPEQEPEATQEAAPEEEQEATQEEAQQEQEQEATQEEAQQEQEPEAAPQEAQQEQEPEAAPQEAQQKPAPVAKPWIGLEIKGRGWRIVFDGSYERTRVIFKRKPSAAAEKAVKDAGFFWSPVMKSWNKKLTCKAFRAAQNLAFELKAICG